MGAKTIDPRVEEIARGLLINGQYQMRLETGNLQAVVDAGWAARQAGQLLGRQVRVVTSRSGTSAGGLVVTAQLVDS